MVVRFLTGFVVSTVLCLTVALGADAQDEVSGSEAGVDSSGSDEETVIIDVFGSDEEDEADDAAAAEDQAEEDAAAAGEGTAAPEADPAGEGTAAPQAGHADEDAEAPDEGDAGEVVLDPDADLGEGLAPTLTPVTPIERAQRDDVEELYVTANKRVESIQDVPISVAALNADFLDDSGITQFGQLQEYVPNLTINPVTDTRGTVIRIRGIGSPGSNAGIDPSVGVFIDGVYQGRAGMSVGDLLDIERVEVLRGPQGTLYGKNTAAGLINVISKRPSYDWEATLESVFGNYDNKEGRASVNIPIVDEHVAARLSAYGVIRDGFDKRLSVDGRTFDPLSGKPIPPAPPGPAPPGFVIKDGRVNDADKWGAKGRVLLDVTESLSFLFSGDYSKEDTACCVADISADDGFPTLSRDLTFQNLAGTRVPNAFPPPAFRPFPLFSGTGIPGQKVDGFDRVVTSNHAPQNLVTVGGVSMDGSYELPDMPVLGGSVLTAIGSWRTHTSDSLFDGDFSYYDVVLAYTNVKLDQYSAELRLTSPGGELVDYQTGFYFYHSDMDTVDRNGFEWDFVNLFPAVLGPTQNIGDNNHKTYSYAGFGQATLNPLEQLSLTGGVRVTNEKKTRYGTQTSRVWRNVGGVYMYVEPLMDAPPIIGPDVVKDEERSVTNVSGMANIRYFPTDDIMFYASFATGFKSGGFNQLRTLDDPNVPSEFDDEESTNYEAGFKTSWLDRMLTFNVTGFYTDYDQFQAQLFDGSSINVVNAGSLRSYGIEADVVMVPLPDLVVGATMGWNIAEYTDFKNGEETAEQRWNETGGFPLSCSGGPGAGFDCVQDLTGEVLENAPVWSLSSFLQYEYPLPWLADAVVFTRGEYSFRSMRYLAQDLDPHLLQGSTHLLNLRLGVRYQPGWWWLRGDVEMTAWMRNVTNESWNVIGFDVPTLNGFATIAAPPRQYGITTRIYF